MGSNWAVAPVDFSIGEESPNSTGQGASGANGGSPD